jgi:acyl carrier protein
MIDTKPIDEFVHRLLLEHGQTEKVGLSDSLILSGLLDSLAIIHIVVFLEEHYGIDFSEIYFDQTGFDSINQIVYFVDKNRSTEN